MASGKTEEALIVFKKIYRTNTGRDLNSFPVSFKKLKLSRTMGSSLISRFILDTSSGGRICIEW